MNFSFSFAWHSSGRVFTESPAKWLVAYGHVYSLLTDMNSLYLVSTRKEDIVAEYPLPPFRRSVRGSNFTPGQTGWLDGGLTRPRESLVFATSMPDYSVLVLMFKEGTWCGFGPVAGPCNIIRTGLGLRIRIKRSHFFPKTCFSPMEGNVARVYQWWLNFSGKKSMQLAKTNQFTSLIN